MTNQLDLRGLIGPITLLMAIQALRNTSAGETLEILGSDLETRKDLFKVLEVARYEIISLQENMTSYRVLLKKRNES